MKKIPLAILVVLLLPVALWWCFAEGGDSSGAIVVPEGAEGPGAVDRGLRIPSIVPEPEEDDTSSGSRESEGREVASPSERSPLPLFHGRVLDLATGSPVEDCRIYRRDGTIRRHLSSTDRGGRFACSPSWPEEEPIAISARPPYGWEFVGPDLLLDDRQRSGEDEVVLLVRSLPGGHLEAVVIDAETDQELAGEELGFRPIGAPSISWVTSGEGGKIRTAHDLPYAKVRVTTHEPDWTKVKSAFIEHGEDQEAPLTIKVLRGPVFAVEFATSLPGKVPDLRVAARTRTIPKREGVVTAVAGRVTPGRPALLHFPRRLSRGRVLVEVSTEGGDWIGVAEGGASGKDGPPLPIEMVRSGGIEGVVVGGLSEPLDGVRVMLLERIPTIVLRRDPTGGRFRLASDVVVSDARGHWRIPERHPGKYVVWAVCDRSGFQTERVVVIAGEKTEKVRLSLTTSSPERIGSVSGELACSRFDRSAPESFHPLEWVGTQESPRPLTAYWNSEEVRVELRRATPFEDDADAWRHRRWSSLAVYLPRTDAAGEESMAFDFGPLPDARYTLSVNHSCYGSTESHELTVRPPAAGLRLECHGAGAFVDLVLFRVDDQTGDPISGSTRVTVFGKLSNHLVFHRSGGTVRCDSILDDPSFRLSVQVSGYSSAKLSLGDCPRIGDTRSATVRLKRDP
jgi:hypothetical protein